MQTHLHLDWLSITIPVIHAKQIDALGDMQLWQKSQCGIYTCDTSKWRTSVPQYGYTFAYTSSHGTTVMFGQQSMGIHIIYSGQSLQALEQAGFGAERLIENANKHGAKSTRADIALDIYDGVSSVSSFANALKLGKAVTASKTWRNLENAEGGQTCYIGSRSSERMVRVYDKKAERASAFVEVGSNNWIRIEAELKGDRAKDFMNACRDNELVDVMRSHLQSTIDFPTISDWKRAMESDGVFVEPTETKRKETKTRHWLLSTVANTLANECAEDMEFLAKFQTEVYALIEQRLSKRGPIDTDK